MSKPNLKQISSLHRWILRQMISRCSGIQVLNKLCNCGAVRFCRRTTLQPDVKVIYASRWPAGCALPKSDRSSGRHRGIGSLRQIACDLMNLCGSETVLFSLLASTGESRECKTNSQQREICLTVD